MLLCHSLGYAYPSNTHTTLNSFLTPARRDGATCILVGDLSNKQREGIFDTLSIPPTLLKKSEFVTWCHDTLGRSNDYTFLAFLKEQKGRRLFLTRAQGLVNLEQRFEAPVSAASGGGGTFSDSEEAVEEAEEVEAEDAETTKMKEYYCILDATIDKLTIARDQALQSNYATVTKEVIEAIDDLQELLEK